MMAHSMANYDSGLPPVFVNQVSLEHSHTHSSGIVCGCLFATTQGSSYNRECYVPPSLKYSPSVPLQKDSPTLNYLVARSVKLTVNPRMNTHMYTLFRSIHVYLVVGTQEDNRNKIPRYISLLSNAAPFHPFPAPGS